MAIVDATAAAVVHTVGATAAAVALVVYEFVGSRILRSAWVNLNQVSAVALVGAGGATVVAATV